MKDDGRTMCDKAHYDKLEGRVDRLEMDFVKHSVASEEKIGTLMRGINRLFWTGWIFVLILLLAVVYGALGERGFRHVACATQEMTPNPGK